MSCKRHSGWGAKLKDTCLFVEWGRFVNLDCSIYSLACELTGLPVRRRVGRKDKEVGASEASRRKPEERFALCPF